MADLDEGQLALLRDIDAGKVQEVLGGDVVLTLDGGESADVYSGAWALYGKSLADTGEWQGVDEPWENAFRVWGLTDAGRAVLEEADRAA